MRFKAILPWLFFAMSLWFAPAFAQDAETLFNTGISAYQKGNLKEAESAFLNSLQREPSNPVVLYNLGLVADRNGRIGYAMALWRKALSIAPGYIPAEQALVWAKGKVERAEIPHQVELWESFHNAILDEVRSEVFWSLALMLFFLSGWLFLRYFGSRRRAALDEKPRPPFPTIATVFAVLFVAAAALCAAKAIDEQILRGTIISKKIEARSSPDNSATPLFDLYEGLEVIVQQTKADWAQVTYPGGSTGWIPVNSLFTNRDKVTP